MGRTSLPSNKSPFQTVDALKNPRSGLPRTWVFVWLERASPRAQRDVSIFFVATRTLTPSGSSEEVRAGRLMKAKERGRESFLPRRQRSNGGALSRAQSGPRPCDPLPSATENRASNPFPNGGPSKVFHAVARLLRFQSLP